MACRRTQELQDLVFQVFELCFGLCRLNDQIHSLFLCGWLLCRHHDSKHLILQTVLHAAVAIGQPLASVCYTVTNFIQFQELQPVEHKKCSRAHATQRGRQRGSAENSACHDVSCPKISCVAMKFRMLTATQISGGKCGLGSLVVMYSLSVSQHFPRVPFQEALYSDLGCSKQQLHNASPIFALLLMHPDALSSNHSL